MEKPKKAKLAVIRGSTCEGCGVALLDLNEKILDLVAVADIVYWALGLDFKHGDLEAMEAHELDICIHHGSIRTSEHEHLARLLREKSKVMVAFGACSCFGGIPGLCNVTTREGIFREVYKDTASTINDGFVTPRTSVTSNGNKLTLPGLKEQGLMLSDVVDVDYYVPGCPPTTNLIEQLIPLIGRFIETQELPPKGTYIAPDKNLCDECPLERKHVIIDKVVRPHQIIPEPDRCLLEQGILCMGPATRAGCGARCPGVLMPCRGCMGPTPGITDQGAKMLSAVASILGLNNEQNRTDEEVDRLMDQVIDPLGTFYRFTLPQATISKTYQEKGKK